MATNDEGAGAGDLSDVFVARYGSGGPMWSARVGVPGLETCLDMAVDGARNIYVTGQFQGTTDFGNGKLTSAGDADVFLVKLSW